MHDACAMPPDVAKQSVAARRAAKQAAKRAAANDNSNEACPGDDATAPTPTCTPIPTSPETTAAAAALTLRFPPTLNPRQRAILHALAERHNIPHSSDGDGDARAIALGSGAVTVQVPFQPAPSEVPDGTLCDLLFEHLFVSDASSKAAFDAPAPEASKPLRSSAAKGAKGAGGGASSQVAAPKAGHGPGRFARNVIGCRST
jgi:hypothetical protein